MISNRDLALIEMELNGQDRVSSCGGGISFYHEERMRLRLTDEERQSKAWKELLEWEEAKRKANDDL